MATWIYDPMKTPCLRNPPMRTKPSLSADSETVLIGFKGSKILQDDLKASAAKLGITYSQLLRAIAVDCVDKIKGMKDEE